VKLAMVAGEASSDLLAADVLRELAGAGPGFAAGGIGGDRMAAAGFDRWWPAERLSVHGYADAIRALPALLWIRYRLRRRILRWPASLFLGIDAPDFNLGLEHRLRQAGLRTVHFVSPSIWAWRPERITTIRAAVDHMLLVFPFEQSIYREAGVRATYVGHPLADSIPLDPDRAAARRQLGIDGQGRDGAVVALLPGSRRGELRRLAALFFEVARVVARALPGTRFLVPAASEARLAELRAHLATARQQTPDLDVTLVDGQSHRVLEAADAVLVASGTATLEAALYKRPMVIAYRVPDLDYRRMRQQALLPYVGLPNILAGSFVVPEFIQDDAQPEPIARALLEALADGPGAARLARRFEALHLSLRQGCAARVAAVIDAESRHGARSRAGKRLDAAALP
jgi:lipid-A-disaccharide synthase